MDFGFVDYKTLEKRKYYCEREIELNRRLCSDIYLDMISIEDESGNVIEYAVKMKQLEDQYFLDSYIEQNELKTRHLDRVADVLYDFYSEQSPDEDILKYGETEKIQYNTDENFEQTETYIGNTITRECYEAVQYFTNNYFKERESLFEKRIEEKRIVDGHGDLHLEHIHVKPDRICIYDCIEFNDRFRYGDIAADLAFLAMDLDFRNCWKEGSWFIQKMSEKLEDPDLFEITDFYKCYRAYVKGKVKSLQSDEDEVDEKDREQARRKAEKYFNLALRYAVLGSRPLLLILMGRIATGKSTIARHLDKTLNVVCFSSDRIRKKLAGVPLHERTPDEKREELYSSEMSETTYRKLYEKSEKELLNGKSVILDATFSHRSARKKLIRDIENQDIQYLFIETQASDKTITSRLKARENSDSSPVSDARLEDFETLDARYESPDEIDDESIIRINTETDFSDTLITIYKKLIEKRLK